MATRLGIRLPALALAGAALASATPARAGGQIAWGTRGPDLSVTARMMMGYAHEQVAPAEPNGIAAGLSLGVRRRALAAEVLFEGAAGGRRDSGYLGLAAGAVLAPAWWLEVELLAEGGGHQIAIESDYAGLPSGRARLPYVGVRAAVLLLRDVVRAPLLLWARRAGVGLQLTARADLTRPSVSVSQPPELGLPPEIVEVGGWAFSAGVLLPLEW